MDSDGIRRCEKIDGVGHRYKLQTKGYIDPTCRCKFQSSVLLFSPLPNKLFFA
jgi:hypothetical protein